MRTPTEAYRLSLSRAALCRRRNGGRQLADDGVDDKYMLLADMCLCCVAALSSSLFLLSPDSNPLSYTGMALLSPLMRETYVFWAIFT